MKKCCLLIAGLSASLALSALAGESVLGPSDNIRISLTRGRSVSDVKGGSIGEKLADFEPVVKIQNASFKDFRGNKVCVLMMGEDATVENNWRVIYRREFDADLIASKTLEWVGDPFKQGFDRTFAKSGYDYDGYIVIIRNSDGRAVISAQTKPLWGKNLEKAWNMAEGSDYSKDHFKN